MRFGVQYDFRNPARWHQPWERRYEEYLEQIDWVESSTAFNCVALTEHHFVGDGYLPSVLPIAAVLAARTERVELATSILQLPLHHPLRVAEDALVVDLLSRGRFRLGVGLGYRELEFTALGTSLKQRRARMEEGLEVLRGAFSGKAFAYAGEHFSFPELTVSPPPTRAGGPPIWIGGSAPAALDRAARLGDGFLGATDADVIGYLEACDRHDVPAERRRTCVTPMLIVAEDPERTLAESGEHLLYQINQYIDYGFLKVPPFEDAQVLLDLGIYTILDAAAAIDHFRAADARGIEETHTFATLPGESVACGTERLRYIADEVIPTFAGSQDSTAHP